MKLSIDLSHRAACRRSHTATHLLHAELAKIFPDTKQAWSYVGPDELRFDFFSDRLLTDQELHALSITINTIITHNEIVSVQEMSYAQAIKTGAKAFFEDTYPEVVRVVSIAFEGNTRYSIELCWGTHVTETGNIWSFVITEQSSVAAGIKRITAITWPKVAAYVRELESSLSVLSHKIGVPVKQIDSKIDKIIMECDQMKEQIKKLWSGLVHTIEWKPKEFSGIMLDGYRLYDDAIAPLWLSFSDAVTQVKQKFPNNSFLMLTNQWQYSLIHPQAKMIKQELGLQGGGSDNFIQGKDDTLINYIKKS